MKHGRLIDADALGNRMYHEVFEKDSEDQKWDSGCWMRYKLFERVLRDAPTIEPERKKGKWIDAEWENINSGEKRKGRRCSVCGHGYFRYDVSVNTVSDIPNFCPNCGADMRGEQNENN